MKNTHTMIYPFTSTLHKCIFQNKISIVYNFIIFVAIFENKNMSNESSFDFQFETFSREELSKEDLRLIENAESACDTAYAPYSHFTVGAALLLENGEVVIGSNQENAAYPSGLCAERVALFNAAANHPKVKIKKIAITARKENSDQYIDVSPCGSCRQVMLEYEELQNQNIEVLFSANKRWTKLPKSALMLPFCFDKKSLG